MRTIGSNRKGNHFTIEIAVADNSDDIIFYVAIPDEFKTLFEAAETRAQLFLAHVLLCTRAPGITDYLRKHPTDLLIMATEGRTGMARLVNSSVAETVTQNTRSHTLMLPKNGHGLIDPSTGRTRLSRVVCALDPHRDPRAALAYLRQWLPAFGAQQIEILMLHTGAQNEATELLLPQTAGLHWRSQASPGDPVTSIVAAADEFDAQLVVMNTRAPLGLRARMRGSRTDKVLRALRLPLLSIPAI